jgi:hypothetical protein
MAEVSTCMTTSMSMGSLDILPFNVLTRRLAILLTTSAPVLRISSSQSAQLQSMLSSKSAVALTAATGVAAVVKARTWSVQCKMSQQQSLPLQSLAICYIDVENRKHLRFCGLKAAAVPFRTTFQYGSACAVDSRDGVGGSAVACSTSLPYSISS